MPGEMPLSHDAAWDEVAWEGAPVSHSKACVVLQTAAVPRGA